MTDGATISTSPQAQSIYLTDAMIDYDGNRTQSLSHKLFGHVNYAWTDREIVPFVGFGGFAEFGSNSSCCSDNTCCVAYTSCCKNVALSQWGMWLKSGASF